MKLISCYITGFGAIKEYSYCFRDGLDAICQENGWGKTTFSIFLKAMFYGLDYSARTKVLTERKHYMPWDGGQCGGSVVFEVDQKRYRVERKFGLRDKEDSFLLIDESTGKESTDFGQNLGEEIFQVDRESFEKSIFIPQASVSTAMTDSLNAKMGNLASAKDDINNFDEAVSRVVEARKSYTRRSKVNNGRLNVIKEELSQCQEVIDKKGAVMDGYAKQLRLLEDKKKSLNWKEAEKNRVAEQIRLQSKREQDMGAYRNQQEMLARKQDDLTALDDFFAKGIPTEEEHDGIKEVEREYDINRKQEAELVCKMPPQQQIEKWEALFREGIPTDEEQRNWKDKATAIRELHLQGEHARLSDEMAGQLEELKKFFSKKLPTEEEVTAVEQSAVELSRLDGRLVEQDEQYRNLQNRKELAEEEAKKNPGFGSIVLLFLMFFVLLGGGIAFHSLIPASGSALVLQIICFGGSVGTLVAAVMQTVRIYSSRRNRERELSQQMSELEENLRQCQKERDELAEVCGAFLAEFSLTPAGSMQQMVYEIRVNLERYRYLLEEEAKATAQTTDAVGELADVRMELYTLLNSYAEVYGMDLYRESCELQLLEQLHTDIAAYEEYGRSCEQRKELENKMKGQQHLLQGYLERFPLPQNQSEADSLNLIQGNLQRYYHLQEEVTKLSEEIEKFRMENQMQEDGISVEELQKQQDALDEEIVNENKGITQDKEALQEKMDEMDAIEDAESRRDVLLEERAECEKKVELLTKTEEFLKQAKEQFLSVYMQPLRSGMERYLALLDEKYRRDAADMEFDITIDLSVQVHYRGATHSSEYLSRGYQDLVALCARFALIDVLYRKEQPVIILDDPFTNFDGDKIAAGLDLLKEIAKERQMIYFTCHESRMP